MIENKYNTADLPAWSDDKLKANIEAAEKELDALGNWENADFLDGLLREEDRRKCDAFSKINSEQREF